MLAVSDFVEAAFNPYDVLSTARRQRIGTQYPDFAAQHLKILDKKMRLLPLQHNRVQQHYIANRTRRDIIIKARQMGMSTCIQGLKKHTIYSGTTSALTLADTDQNTQKLRRMSSLFDKYLPDDIRMETRENSASIVTYPQMDSKDEIATAGSASAGRGGTYNFLHGSEVAFYRDHIGFVTGALQAVPDDGYVALESTTNGAQGWFFDFTMEALDGGNPYTVHFYPWWRDDSYMIPLADGEALTYTDDEVRLIELHGLSPEQIKWRRNKQSEVKHMFQQEYPESIETAFLLSGDSYFGRIPDAVWHTGPDEWRDGMYTVGGLDFGQQKDYTVLAIGDVHSRHQVHTLRINGNDWATIRSRILDTCEQWNVERVTAEYNSIGNPNLEALNHEAWQRGIPTVFERFDTTPKSKPPLIMALYEAIHHGGLRLIDDAQHRREYRAFQAKQTATGHWKYEASGGDHDDYVIADALMWHGMSIPPMTVMEL